MKSNDIVDKLKSIDGQFVWCGSEDGHPNETVVITAEGLYAKLSPYSEFAMGPYCISQRDYKALLSDPSNYIPVDNDLDPEIAEEMISSGCQPDITYYKWHPDMGLDDNYHERDYVMSFLEEMFLETHDPMPWDEIAEEYLLEYYQVVKDAQNMSDGDYYQEGVQISSCDFWFKIVDFLQQNWALIDQQEDGKSKVFFVHDASGVFDTMIFESDDDAQQALLRNGFKRFADDPESQEFITPPKRPFVTASHPNGPIYSSGRFWR